MKKGFIFFTVVLGLFIFTSHASAVEKGSVVIQAIRQPGYNLEMTVQLFNSETKEVVGTYKLNTKNDFTQKDKVPVGKYEISVFVIGMEPRSATKIGGTYAIKEVVAEPKVKGEVDRITRFVVMQGDEVYLDKYFGMMSFQYSDGSMLKGEISDEEMAEIQKEAIAMQGEGNERNVSKNANVGETGTPIDEVKNANKAEKPKKAAQGSKVKSGNETNKTPIRVIAVIVIGLGGIAGYFHARHKKER